MLRALSRVAHHTSYAQDYEAGVPWDEDVGRRGPGIGGSLAKGERRQLSAHKSFETGSSLVI
jgi:hypothetical protein